ncbi:hypothetical protein [Demequina aestuarii]|uniref:hypothetical protein n=1 Tax=Demequina aestuarii TaxID=327095 RepID=UPI000782A3D2|nr:hypothetical protein [Demequina aestuarii]
MISPFEWDLANYAENLLVEQCMNGQGFDWPVPRRDVSSLKPSAVRSDGGRKLFDVDIAAAYGYRSPDWLPPDVVAAEQEFSSLVLTPEKQAAVDRCITQDARDELPLPANYTQLAVDLASEALATALESTEVEDAAAAWRECMGPLGIPDLPESPLAMPTDALMDEWGMDQPGAQASADQISIAVADAECRASSGYDATLYNAELRLQTVALTNNSDELVAEQAEGDAYVARAMSKLAEIGG